jgi:hypothetical protein
MSKSAAAVGSARRSRLATARRAVETGRIAVHPPIPRSATADQRFIAAALNYRRCTREYLKAHAVWAECAARCGYDDPAHADHHTKLTQTRRALQGADEALSVAEEELLGVRS